jgi:glycine/D-amino acid oxidase-like deaminating enzyme/nitrite reductase/ring-hydroxylating ferredoxin subunit
MHATVSIWEATAERHGHPRVERDDLHVDVAVVGAGITGATAAMLVKLAGARVALVDARTVGSGVTAGTTAHITEVIDTRYRTLEDRFGEDGARMAAQSSRAAIERIAELSRRLSIRCDLERLPGYLFTEREDEVEELKSELEAARRAGVRAELERPALPIVVKAGIRFDDQATFNPLSYVLGLADRVEGDGSYVFENSRVLAIDDGDPCLLHFENGATLRAGQVILATHAPIDSVILNTRIAQYRSYVVAGPVEQAPHGLFWDTASPYHYVRSYRAGGRTELIVGGEDHRTGQDPETEEAFDRLAEYAARFGLEAVERRWSAQVIEPVDGLPFIGKNPDSDRVYVATGFSGNGMTLGTVAAMILSDACLGRPNPYADLYAATRVKPFAGLGTFISTNVAFPLHLLSDRLRPPEVRSVEEIERDDGRIVRVGGERLAVYRDVAGSYHAVSAICTHLGCQVAFNRAEKSWDCPCHGSRFALDGSVLDGPAITPLAQRGIAAPETSHDAPREALRKRADTGG